MKRMKRRTKLTAYFHFSTPGLWVNSELLGHRHEIIGNKSKTNSVFIRLPKDNNDFWLADYAPRDYDERLLGSTADTKDNPKERVEVLVLQVGVRFTVNFHIPKMTTNMAILSKLHPYMRAMALQAASVVKVYLDYVAVYEDQPWIKSRLDTPELVHLTQVFDSDGNRVRIGYGSTITGIAFRNDSALTIEKQKKIISRVKQAKAIPLEDDFLRDARYLVSKGGDPAQIVLFAAIACEIKIKTSLTKKASKKQSELLNLVINRPPVVTLMHTACKAICGKSLLEEDKDLYDKLANLFIDRNKVAHHGNVPPRGNARDHVNTAIKLFDWIKKWG
jgi:hypothetical protein